MHYKILFAVVILFCIWLRLWHAATECRISWDEGRPNVEEVIKDPSQIVHEFESSWGRPLAVLAKVVTILSHKALRKVGVARELPEWIPFHILLDVTTLLLLSSLVWSLAKSSSSSHLRWSVTLMAAALWSASPGSAYWSLRFMPPVYASCLLAGTLLLLHHALDRDIRYWFAAGMSAGLTFMVYPGTYAILAGLAVAYAIAGLFLRRTWKVFFVALMGAVLPLVLMEGGMRLAFWSAGRSGYSYLAQLADLKNSINHGDYADGPFAIMAFCFNLDDYVLALVAIACVVAVMKTRTAFCPAAWAFVLAYLYWCVNSAVLHREVVYDRMIVLLIPVGIAGFCELLIRVGMDYVSEKTIANSAVCVSVLAIIAGFCAVQNWDRVRVHASDVKRFASPVLGIPIDSLIVLDEFQDYGETVSQHPEKLREAILREQQLHPGSTVLVAFNLRSSYFVRVAPETSAYAHLPAVVRFPKHCTGRECQGIRCVTPELKALPEFPENWSDIKVYSVETILPLQ